MVVAPVVLVCHLCAGTPRTFFFLRGLGVGGIRIAGITMKVIDWAMLVGLVSCVWAIFPPSLCHLVHPNACSRGQPTSRRSAASSSSSPARPTQLNYWLQDEYNIWRDSSALSTLTIKHGTWCTIWMEIRECVMFLHWSSTVCNKLMITLIPIHDRLVLNVHLHLQVWFHYKMQKYLVIAIKYLSTGNVTRDLSTTS